MDTAGSALRTCCLHCGGDLPPDSAGCVLCGMPATPGPPAAPPIPGVPGGLTASGPQLTFVGVAPGGRGGFWPSSGRALIALGVVAVLLIGGGTVYTILRLTAPTAASTVQDYFDALGDGDAASALALVADAQQYDPGVYPLLTDAALADGARRPGDVRVEDGETVGTDDASEFESVEVTYRVDGTTVTQTIFATKTSEGYALQGPFLRFGVAGVAGRAISVNGVPMGADEIESIAFPGTFAITAEGSALFAPAAATVVPQARGFGELVAAVDLGTPTLAGGVDGTVAAQVRSLLDACAASTEVSPPDCPFRTYLFDASDASVKWTITTYPTVRVAVEDTMFRGLVVTVDDDGAGGVAHYEGTYTDYLGAKQTVRGDQRFPIDGTVQATGSGITVSLH